MAEILITGMEMPKDGDLTLIITPKGEIILGGCIFTHNFGKEVKAIEVPPHGELKNATHIINELERQLEMEKKAETPFSESAQGNAYMRKCRIEVLEWVICNIKNQPTIVEASKERE